MIEPHEITNRLDGALAVQLGALLARRDLPAEFVHRAWCDTLGTLGRKNLRAAVTATPGFQRRFYRLHPRCEQTCGAGREEDHVFPLHEWKEPMLAMATEQRWGYDMEGVRGLRAFVQAHYLTAVIPPALHRRLPRKKMPEGWTYTDERSMWARYKTPAVTAFMKRELRVPGEDDPDFIPL